MNLTNAGEFVALELYRIYKDRLESGKSQSESKYFYDARIIYENHFNQHRFDDFVENIRELSREKYVNAAWADDNFAEMVLEPKLIRDVENRFSNKFDSVLDRLYKLRKLLF